MSHNKGKSHNQPKASPAAAPVATAAPATVSVVKAKAPDHGHGPGHAHVHGPGCAHDAHAHAHPPYMKVFYGLVVLTAAEVLVVYLHLPRAALVGTLVSMSLAKAALVGMYFMHLALDNRKLMVVVLSPFVLSAMLFLIPVLETHSSQPSPPKPDKAKPAK